MNRSRPQHRIAALAAVPLLIGLFAGCSAEQDTKPSADSASDSAGTSQQQYDAWNMKFRTCLKDKGVDVPDDPKQGLPLDDSSKDPMETCMEEVGEPPAQAGQPSEQEQLDGIIRMNECLRERGYDVKDPTPGEPIMLPNITPEDQEACNPSAK